MRFLLVFLSAVCFASLKGQNTIVFSYDNAGNMIQRQVQVIIPGPGMKFMNPYAHAPGESDSLNSVEFKVFPNPAKDKVFIDGPLPEGVEQGKLYLINANGQVMMQDGYAGRQKEINLNDLKPGLYYLEINYSKKRSSNYKIVITN